MAYGGGYAGGYADADAQQGLVASTGATAYSYSNVGLGLDAGATTAYSYHHLLFAHPDATAYSYHGVGLSDATAYSYHGVGLARPASRDAAAYSFQNAGVFGRPVAPDATSYSYHGVGVQLVSDPVAGVYSFHNAGMGLDVAGRSGLAYSYHVGTMADFSRGAEMYSYQNAGFALLPSWNDVTHQYENVGFYIPATDTSHVFTQYENVGFYLFEDPSDNVGQVVNVVLPARGAARHRRLTFTYGRA